MKDAPGRLLRHSVSLTPGHWGRLARTAVNRAGNSQGNWWNLRKNFSSELISLIMKNYLLQVFGYKEKNFGRII